LFLNKSDLLKEKLPHSRVAEYFPDYHGDNSFDSVIEYFSKKFNAVKADKDKAIYVHSTCATDEDQVMFLFDAVKDIFIRGELNKTGVL